jgi:hypothetical protein
MVQSRCLPSQRNTGSCEFNVELRASTFDFSDYLKQLELVWLLWLTGHRAREVIATAGSMLLLEALRAKVAPGAALVFFRDPSPRLHPGRPDLVPVQDRL